MKKAACNTAGAERNLADSMSLQKRTAEQSLESWTLGRLKQTLGSEPTSVEPNKRRGALDGSWFIRFVFVLSRPQQQCCLSSSLKKVVWVGGNLSPSLVLEGKWEAPPKPPNQKQFQSSNQRGAEFVQTASAGPVFRLDLTPFPSEAPAGDWFPKGRFANMFILGAFVMNTEEVRLTSFHVGQPFIQHRGVH